MCGQGLCGAEILHPATDLAKNQYRKFQDPEGAIIQSQHTWHFFKRLSRYSSPASVIRMCLVVWVTAPRTQHRKYCLLTAADSTSTSICDNVFARFFPVKNKLVATVTSWVPPPVPWHVRPPYSWTAARPPAPPSAPPAPPTARPLWQWGHLWQCWEHFC